MSNVITNLRGLIEELRGRTGAGILDCQNAIKEAQGNVEEAVTILRKKGIAKAEKKADRTAAEGLIGLKISGKSGAIIEVNSETDFVARNEKFQALCNNIIESAYKNHGDLEKTLASPYAESQKSVTEEIKENSGIIGERLTFRRASFISVDSGIVVSYIHNSTTSNLGKIGVLITLKSSADEEQLKVIGKQIAMHIAATSPKALNINEVDSQLIEKEKQIYFAEAETSGKPANVIEKMIEGKMRKFYEEVVLLEQFFVMDNKLRVKEFLESKAKELNSSIEIEGFIRYQVGEGIEKAENNFADEVAAITGKK
jgi:elongation factor Ts